MSRKRLGRDIVRRWYVLLLVGRSGIVILGWRPLRPWID
jgi:hypothetical protein